MVLNNDSKYFNEFDWVESEMLIEATKNLRVTNLGILEAYSWNVQTLFLNNIFENLCVIFLNIFIVL